MRALTIDEIAERWSLAHTIAVGAWVVVVVLGVVLLVRSHKSTYPSTEARKTYAAENATFTYPANWTINNCVKDKQFMELPGTIKSDYKGGDAMLKMYGAVAYKCVKGRPERFDLYPEKMVASTDPCAPGTSTKGERLKNGLYLQVEQREEQAYAVHVKQNACYAPADTVVIGFAFIDPEASEEDWGKFGPPRMSQKEFLKSPQYRDIHALAESIRY
jgi:hypothetical protein